MKAIKDKKRGWGITEKRLLAACVFLAAAGILLLAADRVPGFVQWYTTHIYAKLAAIYGRSMGWIPFSVSEAGLYLLLLLLPATGIRALWRAVQKERTTDERKNFGRGGTILLRWASGIFLTASVLLFLYVGNCGINYRRTSFSEAAGIQTDPYAVERLQEVCVWLTTEVEERARKVKRNEEGEMRLWDGEEIHGAGYASKMKGYPARIAEEKQTLEKAAVQAMQELSEKYPELKGVYPNPKPVFVSEILSFQGLTGIYSPFTMEANYNQDMPEYNLPFTVCHELSHLRGFMQEEEANFIAFLACAKSGRTDFQYSGYLTAWIYSMNALRRADPTLWKQVRAKMPETVEADLQENALFWECYDGKVAEVSDRINDTYLKVNGQSAGVQSYGKMVDLVIAYYYTYSGSSQ